MPIHYCYSEISPRELGSILEEAAYASDDERAEWDQGRRTLLDDIATELHTRALADPDYTARESAYTMVLSHLSTSALTDMHNTTMEQLADAESYGAACIWLGRLERELAERGHLIAPAYEI